MRNRTGKKQIAQRQSKTEHRVEWKHRLNRAVAAKTEFGKISQWPPKTDSAKQSSAGCFLAMKDGWAAAR